MGVDLKGRRVLIVDDDENNREILEEALSRENVETKTAIHGREALDILATWSPQLILLDQDMPVLNGIETLKEIRRRKLECAVMFISAHSGSKAVSEALEAGADDFVKKPFSLEELMSRIKVRFRIMDLHTELQDANEQLYYLSQHDDVTSLYNMRSMYDRIDHELARCRRSGGYTACVMMDMDHFKTVNDHHDHLFGSFVLKEVGRLLKETMRETDFAARYGGDEFLIVLTGTEEKGFRIFCERFLNIIRGHEFTDGHDRMRLTASLGYAVSPEGAQTDARELVRFADHALYVSKEGGRDRVTGVGPEEYLKKLSEKKSA